MRSFVFPRNQIARLELLSKFGIQCFRGVLHRKWLAKIRGVSIFNELLGPIPSKLRLSSEGLVDIPSARYPNLTSSLLPLGIEGIIHLTGIKRAQVKTLRNKQILHLWTHESNLNDQQLRYVEYIFRLANGFRNRGLLNIMTMCEVCRVFNGIRA